MAERLASGNTALALLANTLATAAGLYVLIELFGPLSGAHFNPLVSVLMAGHGQLSWRQLPSYISAQLLGATLGAVLANAMFGLTPLHVATQPREAPELWLAEVVATAGLMLVVLRAPAPRVAACVALYIGAAYWFTASTAFANPAAAWGRMWSDSFAGIAPGGVPGFVIAQSLGAGLGWLLHRALGSAARP